MAAPNPSHERVPPGQIVTPRWPVLHAGSVPTELTPATWSLTLGGEVDAPQTLSFAQLLSLPQVDITTDIHCVTSWTKLGMRWRGVPFRAIESLAKPRPNVRFVIME
ncbi:MAG: molybdopterin-dependent oxidoreductase, partial [Thermoplasmata archaeon]|nr:molybdopterin-dependent oxidoreductase [Thermoplasmata archaeon]